MKGPSQLRKVQLTGGSTYVVSLPKNWAKAAGIKPGDHVQLIPQPDMSLLIVPGEGKKREELSEVLIDAPLAENPEDTARELIACYLVGYDIIRLRLGRKALTASVILSIMTAPTIVSISSEVISSVPKEFRKASLALGATKWQTLKSVVLPTAKPGIVASILLAFGRAIGETVAVLMVCGCVPEIPSPPWNYFEPVHTLTAAIALEMGEVPWESLHYHALFGLGVVLFTITFIVNTIVDFIMKKAPKGAVQI